MVGQKEKNIYGAQSCNSKECKNKYGNEIKKGGCEAITTPHIINLIKRTTTCLDCQKVNKF